MESMDTQPTDPIVPYGSTAEREVSRAALYVRIGWKDLEFEERADARSLARRGWLLFNPLRLPKETLCDCGHIATPTHGGFTTGYGTDRDTNQTHCFACCGIRDRARMIETGKATLYLTRKPGAPTASERGEHWHADTITGRGGFGRVRNHPRAADWQVSNWPGTLAFPVLSISRSEHGGGFGSQRTDAYFTGPDGCEWHAVNRGDMDIARCHRMKSQPKQTPN